MIKHQKVAMSALHLQVENSVTSYINFQVETKKLGVEVSTGQGEDTLEVQGSYKKKLVSFDIHYARLNIERLAVTNCWINHVMNIMN